MTSSTSSITQCPSCATKFKVTQEQLSVSEGWVRCGRCEHVFDATEHLLDAQLTKPLTATPAATNALQATAAAEQDDAANPRPSERWLKELSDTFSPTDASASSASAPEEPDADTATALSALTTAELAQTAPSAQALDSAASETLTAADADADQTAPAPGATTTADAAPAEATEPVKPQPSDSTDAETDALGNDIASFHDELARWQAKQAPYGAARPAISEDTPEHADSPNDFSGEAPQQAPEAPEAPDTTDTAQTPAPSEPAAATQSANAVPPTDAAAQDSDNASPTPEQLSVQEEEERLERYRAEFSETQELRFMRDAEHKAFWRRPAIRLCMGVLVLLLLTLLAGQWAYVQRDVIAASSPQWKARMQQACTWAGCSIAPLQAIEDLVLDGSTFQHEGGNRYTLSWTVRNRSNRWIQTPALSLSLRNQAGEILVRRTIAVTELADTPAELAPSGAWQARQQLVLTDYAAAITGYQLQIFYPNAP